MWYLRVRDQHTSIVYDVLSHTLLRVTFDQCQFIAECDVVCCVCGLDGQRDCEEDGKNLGQHLDGLLASGKGRLFTVVLRWSVYNCLCLGRDLPNGFDGLVLVGRSWYTLYKEGIAKGQRSRRY